MGSRPSSGAPLLALALVIGACTGGPGPLPDDQTGGTSAPSGSGRGEEESPSTAEPAAPTTENPPADDDGADDGRGDQNDQHDGG